MTTEHFIILGGIAYMFIMAFLIGAIANSVRNNKE
jgi:hypothetical protein